MGNDIKGEMAKLSLLHNGGTELLALLDLPAAVKDCPDCGGSGNYLSPLTEEQADTIEHNGEQYPTKPCPTCKGKGKLVACKPIRNSSETTGFKKVTVGWTPITRAYHADHAVEFLNNEFEIKWMPMEDI